ncbi:hypothetical protein [Streptomyces sp. NPDC048272]|uniref:hypothetical protein n=1 Tax=Streptomyces sp. NPDC048272 TaxID=3154616 RepID=UPI003415A417
MASALYPSFKALLLTAGINMATDDIRAVIIDSADYTFSAGHDFLDDVPGGARVAVSSALSSKTTTGGTFDAADPTLTAVTGDSVEAVVLYKHTGSDATANLIAYIDGVTITPNGGNITIQWDPTGIFSL